MYDLLQEQYCCRKLDTILGVTTTWIAFAEMSAKAVVAFGIARCGMIVQTVVARVEANMVVRR